jgi:hypothetical protein
MTVVDLRHHKADYGYDGDYRKVSAPAMATIVGTVSAGLLASAARSLALLPNGRAVGVDIWRADQTGNSQENTLHNAELECVADRVEVRTADITDLPFDFTNRYVRRLRRLGWTDVRRRNLGWRMWWGPGMGTHLITAIKPA